jgi:ABC-type transport system involved in multi-copper enzyme maturation permease subunit
MIWNRVGLILVAMVCLTWLYLRFTTADRSKQTSFAGVSLDLSTTNDNVTYQSDDLQETRRGHQEKRMLQHSARFKHRFNSFFAVFKNEVLLNSKRVAPYIVAALSAGNAVLWWGWGPATGRNMATNSDAFIAGVLPFFCFLFQPLLAMIIMADPTVRDFRAEINPLIFSKPVSRAEYLLGKFFGNFFTLSCCQFMFSATLFVLQWVPKQGMVVQEAKFLAYPKHFLAYVVISYLPLAAFYFTVGTLTRNVKIVYGLGIAIYPVFISYAIVFLKRLPWRWGALLDPLLINWGNKQEIHATSAEVFNQLVIVYDSIFVANRIGMILLTAICLTILYKLFSYTERSSKTKELTVIKLSTAAEGVYYPDSPQAISLDEFDTPAYRARTISTHVDVPEVFKVNGEIRADLNKLIAAIGVEFRLLRAERSLVVIMPLAIFLCLLEVAFYPIHADTSLSAAYATNTATSLLIFLIGMAVFYTGEAMHRDREVRIESFLWTTPVPNSVLIMSKFFSTLVLLFGLITSVWVAAVAIQLIRHHTPIDFVAYFKVYGLILFPSAFILTAISVMGNVVLRNKYVFYVGSIGTAAGLFYLYTNGYNHWLYNPVMYRIWSYADLTQGATRQAIIWQRAFWLVAAVAALVLAHLFFERKSARSRFHA